jgi:hypothetical protein
MRNIIYFGRICTHPYIFTKKLNVNPFLVEFLRSFLYNIYQHGGVFLSRPISHAGTLSSAARRSIADQRGQILSLSFASKIYFSSCVKFTGNHRLWEKIACNCKCKLCGGGRPPSFLYYLCGRQAEAFLFARLIFVLLPAVLDLRLVFFVLAFSESSVLSAGKQICC